MVARIYARSFWKKRKKKKRLKYEHKPFSKASEIQCAGSENL